MDDFNNLEGGDMVVFKAIDTEKVGVVVTFYSNGYGVRVNDSWLDNDFVGFDEITRLVKSEWHDKELKDKLIVYDSKDSKGKEVHLIGYVINEHKNYCLVTKEPEGTYLVHRKDIVRIVK